MATLAQNLLDVIAAAVQRKWSNLRDSCGFLKTDLAAAITATDSWQDTNAASFNAALPVNFRTNATLAQKTLVFCYVALKRAGIILGEE